MDLQPPRSTATRPAARRIRALPALAHVPIVAVTALAMVGDRDNVLSVGLDGYLSKPIEPDTFVGEVESVITDRLARG